MMIIDHDHRKNDHHHVQGVPGIIYWRGNEAVTNYIMMAPAAEVLLVHQEDGDGGDGDECQNEVGE